jgi:hypothetical protein
MATAAQIDANRANAQHSTGPVTSDGKARVAQNAVRHGLTAKHLVVREDEREDFAALRDQLSAEIDPRGALECLAFDELLHAAWNLRRFRRIEAEVSIGTIDDFTDTQTAAVLDRLTRYQARAQRAYTRALSELRSLQTNRALRQDRLASDAALEVPALAEIRELTKQTQSDTSAKAVDLALKLVKTDGVALKTRLLREYADSHSPATAFAAAQL